MKAIKIVTLLIAALCLAGLGAMSQKPRAYADPLKTPATAGELLIRGKDGKSGGACPLKHTDVNAEISGFIARVNVTQEFHNPTDTKIEAIYTFPLPEDSAVDSMEMKVGARTIVGEIHRREEAQAIYQAAREAGHVASLLDQERPNIFTQSVANIMPGEKVTITISYTQMLKYEAGRYEFVFPMVVGPRYIPGSMATGRTGTGWSPNTNQVPDASRITPPVTAKGTRAGHDISLSVSINAGIPIYSIKSELHEVDVDRPFDTTATVTLKDKATIPNKDFVLRYDVAGEMVQNGIITHAPDAHGGFFTLIFQPPKSPKPRFVTPKQMIFIQDTSGSQQGEPIGKSKETMFHCIKNMNPGDTFNLIAFSNEPRMLFDKPQDYDATTEAKALKYMKECEAGGGTEIIPALKIALAQPPDPKRIRIVVIFTDGYVGNDMEIVDFLQKNAGSARVFVMGIGNGVNRFVIEKMAEVGRGASDFVLLNSDGQQIAKKFYERIRNPLVTDIEIDWNGLPIAVEDVFPKRVPDLFGAQPVIVKGRFTGPASGEIIVRGKVAGEAWVRTIPVNFPANQMQNDSLASIWARAKVEDLMDKDWLGAQTGSPNEDIKEQIINVALDYHLMTQYTSFVAVEKMIVTDGGEPRTIAVPVEMPEGVSYEGVFGMDGDAVSAGGYGGRAAKMRFSVNYFALAAPSPPMTSAAKPPSGAPLSPNGVEQAQPFDLDTSIIVNGDEDGIDEFKKILKSRLDKTLLDLVEKYRKSGDSGSYSIPGKLVVKDGKVEVMIWVKDITDEKLAQLRTRGLVDDKWLVQGKILIGWVPVTGLVALAELDSITRIAAPSYGK